MRNTSNGRGGFTLLEITISASLLVVTFALITGGFLHVLRAGRRAEVQNELDIDVQTAMERVKTDVRLTSLDKMFFYPPGAGPYTGMEFPMARDDDGDGAVDLDAAGNIIWDRTVVYHVWSGEPTQLRRTVFDPRDNNLTDVQRQEQINSVVAHGNGDSTYNGANAVTETVFENLFRWSISPQGTTYDGYSATAERDQNVVLGSCVLSNGTHTFQFTVIGKNAASSGYRIGIDSLTVSPCYGTREAEAQLPATASYGATPVATYMSGGSWSANYQLQFPATAVNHYFRLSMENDRWEETNFQGVGGLHQDTVAPFDTALTPYDFALQLNGLKTNWFANAQTGDTNGTPSLIDRRCGYAMRVLLRGNQMTAGGWLPYSGGRCRVNFRAGADVSQKLKIDAAYIAECASSETNTMDAAAGTVQQLRFAGSAGITVSGGQSAWSDYVTLPVDRERSYLVTYLVGNGEGNGNPWKWQEYRAAAAAGTYMLPSATLTDVQDATWTSKAGVVTTNAVFGVQYLYTTYPTNGLYTSPVIDTQSDAPQYSDMLWTSVTPSGTALSLQVRSADNSDMSDAVDWAAAQTLAAPGAIDPGDRRYLQFRAVLRPDGTGLLTPKLKHVILRWPGEPRFVDIGATMTKGANYGIFEVKVDGVKLRHGVNIDLEIFRDIRGYAGQQQRITSALTAEVTPRNTGR